MSKLCVRMQKCGEEVREGEAGIPETVLGTIAQILFNLLGDPTRYVCGRVCMLYCTGSCHESLYSPVDQRCQFMQAVSLSEWLLTLLGCLPPPPSSSTLTNLLSLSTSLTLIAIATGRGDAVSVLQEHPLVPYLTNTILSHIFGSPLISLTNGVNVSICLSW